MSYEGFQEETYRGKIEEVKILPLKEHITDEARLAKWGKFDEEGDTPTAEVPHVIVYIDVGNFVKDFVLGRNPVNRQGYQRSNVKKFIDKNGLPGTVDKWPGCEVELRDNKEGFAEVAL